MYLREGHRIVLQFQAMTDAPEGFNQVIAEPYLPNAWNDSITLFTTVITRLWYVFAALMLLGAFLLIEEGDNLSKIIGVLMFLYGPITLLLIYLGTSRSYRALGSRQHYAFGESGLFGKDELGNESKVIWFAFARVRKVGHKYLFYLKSRKVLVFPASAIQGKVEVLESILRSVGLLK